jgi:hypothetical protein
VRPSKAQSQFDESLLQKYPPIQCAQYYDLFMSIL